MHYHLPFRPHFWWVTKNCSCFAFMTYQPWGIRKGEGKIPLTSHHFHTISANLKVFGAVFTVFFSARNFFFLLGLLGRSLIIFLSSHLHIRFFSISDWRAKLDWLNFEDPFYRLLCSTEKLTCVTHQKTESNLLLLMELKKKRPNPFSHLCEEALRVLFNAYYVMWSRSRHISITAWYAISSTVISFLHC